MRGSASFSKALVSSLARAPRCDTSTGGLACASTRVNGFSKSRLSLLSSPVGPSSRGINSPFLVQVQAISNTSLAYVNPIRSSVAASSSLIELRPLSAPPAREVIISEATTNPSQFTSAPTPLLLLDALSDEQVLSIVLKKKRSTPPSAKIRKKSLKKTRYLVPTCDDPDSATCRLSKNY